MHVSTLMTLPTHSHASTSGEDRGGVAAAAERDATDSDGGSGDRDGGNSSGDNSSGIDDDGDEETDGEVGQQPQQPKKKQQPLPFDDAKPDALVRVCADMQTVARVQMEADLEWSPEIGSARCGTDAVVIDRDYSDRSVQIRFQEDGEDMWVHIDALVDPPSGGGESSVGVGGVDATANGSGGGGGGSGGGDRSAVAGNGNDEKTGDDGDDRDAGVEQPVPANYFALRFRSLFNEKMQQLRDGYSRRNSSHRVQWYTSLGATAELIQKVWRSSHHHRSLSPSVPDGGGRGEEKNDE